MYYVYALKSTHRNYIYVGMTSNLDRRISEHNRFKERTTRAYAPFVLIYYEVVENRVQARKREKYFKSGVGKEFIRSLV
jgi:putative endonuclease